MVDTTLSTTLLLALGFTGAVLTRPEPETVDARIVFVEGAGWLEGSAVRPALGPDVQDGDHIGWGVIRENKVSTAVAAAVAPLATPTHSLALGQPLHLNTASTAELVALPGIGPALAARIVSHRPYGSLADLDAVPGIGPTTLRRLSPLVVP